MPKDFADCPKPIDQHGPEPEAGIVWVGGCTPELGLAACDLPELTVAHVQPQHPAVRGGQEQIAEGGGEQRPVRRWDKPAPELQ